MDADKIYQRIGIAVVMFQLLEEKLIDIGTLIIDPERKNYPNSEELNGLWFKDLTIKIKELFANHLVKLKYRDKSEHNHSKLIKQDFEETLEECQRLAEKRNDIVHSFYIHIEVGEELQAILRSNLRRAKKDDSDQEWLNDTAFEDFINECGKTYFRLGQIYIQLIHWTGIIDLKKNIWTRNIFRKR